LASISRIESIAAATPLLHLVFLIATGIFQLPFCTALFEAHVPCLPAPTFGYADGCANMPPEYSMAQETFAVKHFAVFFLIMMKH
jgi:hypothetical protein